MQPRGLRPGRREFLQQALGGIASAGAISSAYAANTPSVTRVACLDWALAESMIALNKPPLAVVAAADWKRFVVEPPLPEKVIDLGLQQELNFELLASLEPQLILTSPFLQHLEPKLRRIGEILNISVYEDGGAPLAQREAVIRSLGEHLDAEDAAVQYLESAVKELDEAKRLIERVSDRPLVLATFIDGRHLRVYGGSSLYQNVLDRLGIENGWTESTGYFGFATVGIEELAQLGNINFVAFDPIMPDSQATLNESPLWLQLPFVRERRFKTLPPVLMFGGLPSALRLARLLAEHLEKEKS